MGSRLERRKLWADHIQTYSRTFCFFFGQVQQHDTTDRKNRPLRYLHSTRTEKSKNCPCGEGPQTVQHILLCRPNFQEPRDHMGSTKPKRSETPPWIGETGETSSPISHQHKNTPTILAREPILGRGRRPRRRYRRDRGGRHLITDSQARNRGLRILNYDGGHRAPEFRPSSPTASWVRSRLSNWRVLGKLGDREVGDLAAELRRYNENGNSSMKHDAWHSSIRSA